jgi:lyso-ornithine lipid O-acyltransferase
MRNNWLLVPPRMLGVVLITVAWFLVQVAIWISPSKDPIRMRLVSSAFFAKVMLWNLGVLVELKGDWDGLLSSHTPCLLAANHLSWLDPLAMYAFMPSRFVTSEDVRRHPFLGFVTTWASCFFMSRKAGTVKQELAQLQSSNSSRLAFYPEATSSNGETVLDFKPAIFELSCLGNIPVAPVVIHFTKIGQGEVTVHNRDLVCYYGDMYFLPHLLRLCAQRSVTMQLELLPMVYPADSGNDRKALSKLVHSQITAKYPTINTHDKEAYLKQF